MMPNPQPPTTTYWWKKADAPTCTAPTPKPGDMCPACGNGRLAYNGLFILTCPACHKAAEHGAFT